MLLQARQDDDGAEAVYKRALRCDPAHLPSLFNLASLLRNVRQVGCFRVQSLVWGLEVYCRV